MTISKTVLRYFLPFFWWTAEHYCRRWRRQGATGDKRFSPLTATAGVSQIFFRRHGERRLSCVAADGDGGRLANFHSPTSANGGKLQSPLTATATTSLILNRRHGERRQKSVAVDGDGGKIHIRSSPFWRTASNLCRRWRRRRIRQRRRQIGALIRRNRRRRSGVCSIVSVGTFHCITICSQNFMSSGTVWIWLNNQE